MASDKCNESVEYLSKFDIDFNSSELFSELEAETKKIISDLKRFDLNSELQELNKGEREC